MLTIASPAKAVRLLTLDRPERLNALSNALLAAVASALREADRDDAVHVVVVTGGASLFAAGADIAEIATLGDDEQVESPRFCDWQAVSAVAKPVIAAVEGWCLGAGLELALACDIVVAG